MGFLNSAANRIFLALAGSGLLASTPSLPAATAVTLTDIALDSTILQRVAGGTTKTITVSGTYTGTASSIQARAVPVGTAVTAGGYAWTTIQTNPTGGTYSGSLTVAQGSTWLILQVRDGVNHTVNAVGSNRFGVGALIALIGQSNMVHLSSGVYQYPLSDLSTRRYVPVDGIDGSGNTLHDTWQIIGNYDLTNTYPPNTISSVYGGTYTTAPIPGYRADGAVYLANYLRSTLGIFVGLLEYAKSGTAISTWQPGGSGTYWTRFATGLTSAGGDCEAAIWYQGEDDASNGTSGASYQTSLGNVLTGLLAATGRSASTFNFGVVVLGPILGYGGSTPATTDAIRAAHLAYIAANTSNGVYMAGVATDGNLAGGTVHIDNVSEARMGKRYALSYSNRLGLATHGAAGPKISSASHSGAVVTVNVAQDGGTALQDGTGGSGGSLLGFRVYDNAVLKTISTTSISGNTIVLTMSASLTGPVTMDYGMGGDPYTTTTLPASVVYDNNTVPGDTLGLPLQPIALFSVS